MLNTFLISYRLKNTYRVNGIIYGLKQIPIIKRFLPTSLYKNTFLKVFANILSTIWEILTVFLGKIIYFAAMFALPLMVMENNSTNIFLQLLLFLSIGGSLFNTGIFSPTKDKYYAVVLMKMDARQLVLSECLYGLIRHIVGFIVCFMIFSSGYQMDSWLCYILAFGIIGLKLIVTLYRIEQFKKKRAVRSETNNSPIVVSFSIACLVIGYASIYFNILIPVELLIIIFAIAMIIGCIALVYIFKYSYYHQFAYKLLNNGNMFINQQPQEIVNDSYHKVITLDTNINSNKKGFEYFNELFMVRHKKILWRTAIRQALFCGGIVVLINALLIFDPSLHKEAGAALTTMLPYMVFVLYLINTAKNVTQAMFVNCDHSMLTYSFYRIPKNVLELFKLRLREVIKINLLPALIIAIGYILALIVCSSEQLLLYSIVTFVSIVSMSIFFSTHYLVLYYLLQPYNSYTEIKSPVYSTITSLTYFVCYGFTKVELPTFSFGIVCILFSVSYCIISCVLVYKKAGSTFRIRN